MVWCWMAAECGDTLNEQRSPLQLEPPQPVSLKELEYETGVRFWKLDADNYESEGLLKKIRVDRGYSYSDIISISKKALPRYDEMIRNFFRDEEIRFALEGSGYLDVRDRSDHWVRVHLEKGDLIVLPAGIYHRFTLDDKNYMKAMRLFAGDPV